jgi:hypothetical protein
MALAIAIAPSVEDAERRALQAALQAVGASTDGSPRYADSWRHAALHEGVEPDELDADYALSPRRTRGATRA